MNLQHYLQEQLEFWHGTLGQMVRECDAETLHRTAVGSTANTIAATYAHVVLFEDFFVQTKLREQPATMFESEGWGERTGVAPSGWPPLQTPEWSAGVRLDPATFAPYAARVYQATDAYLRGLSDDDLEITKMGLFRESTAGRMLMAGVYAHAVSHAGEIAALRGTFGMRGLPF